MNKCNQSAAISFLPMSRLQADFLEDRIRVSDERVAHLLIVLHEVDVGIKTVKAFSEHELSQIVADAILACGFKDFDEARRAVGPLLDAIELPETTVQEDS